MVLDFIFWQLVRTPAKSHKKLNDCTMLAA